MNGFTDPNFWYTTALGFLGVALWFLKSYNDPKDESITSLAKVFTSHGKALIISTLAYLISCVFLWELQELSVAAAIGAGYAGQSLTESLIGNTVKKLAEKGN